MQSSNFIIFLKNAEVTMMMDPVYFLNVFCPKPSKKKKKMMNNY